MADPATAPRYVLRGGERWRDPWTDYQLLRDDGPVHRAEHPEYGEFFVLSRFTDVFDAVRDTETFSSAQGLTLDADVMDIFEGRAAPIVMMDPPDHTAMRRLVSRPMTPRAVATTEPEITAFVDARLDEVADVDGELDIIERLFKPLPSFIVAHYLGVPTEDRARFDGWTDAIVAANASGEMADASEAFASLFEYGNELIDLRRREPADDLVSDLVRAGEERADAFWIVGFVFTMVTGGNDTTTGLLGGAAALLTEYRDQRRLLLEDARADPVVGGRVPAVDNTGTESRCARPRGMSRSATQTIPADRKVMLLYGSANRDEREFGPTAGELDVTRSIDKILSFGYGAHHCLGAAAARHGAAVALTRLLDRFPNYEVDAARGRYAPGPFVRRFESLPFMTHP